MRKNEIDELVNIYENYGVQKLVTKIYEIQKQYKDKELNDLLVAYMHLTNRNNNSYYYVSNREQIVTNNTASIIYFSKNLFNFKNINDKKIVTKESFNVDETEMMEMLADFRALCGNKLTPTNDIEFVKDKVVVTTKHNSAEFNKQEFEIIAKLLNYPSFNLADNSSSLYMQGINGYAYVKGRGTQKNF